MSYCPHCGTQLPRDSQFCTACGRPLSAPETKPGALRPLAAILAVLVVVLGVVIALIVFRSQETLEYDDCMAFAAHYLEELDFEQAEAMYLEAIQLDPSQVEAYRALAELYIDQERFEDALDILERGIAATGSGELQEMYDELRARLEPEEEPAEEPEAAMRIELNWEPIYEDGNEYILYVRLDGTLDDGTSVFTPQDSQEVTGPDGDLILRVTRETGYMLIELYRTDGRLDLDVDGAFEGLDPFSGGGNGLVALCDLTVSVSGSDSGYFTTDEGMYRSYTGVWFWGPFGIDHGRLCEYDTQWLEDGYAHLDPDYFGTGDDTEDASADETAQAEETQNRPLEDRIAYIRAVYNDTEGHLDEYESYLTTDLISCYFDGDILKKIVAQPGAYEDNEDCPPGDYTASYYYDDDLTLLFVFVKDGAEEHRYYLDANTCYRYIDSDGITHDYPDGISTSDLDGPSFFCNMGYLEPHWMNLI